MIFSNYIYVFTIIFTLLKNVRSRPQLYFAETHTCECGISNELSTRIVGGLESDPHLYPWMVAIFQRGELHCGGSLINNRYVLTAGHCLNWSKKEDLKVVLGMHSVHAAGRGRLGGITAEIEDFTVHEDFSSDHLHDSEDIGLIKLKYPVNYTVEISPVCLARDGREDYANKVAHISGWGRLNHNGRLSNELMRTKVRVMSNKECSAVPTIGDHLEDSMLCAYGNSKDACQGDSGGPLTYERASGKTEQIGIISWGIGCAEPIYPGVYVRVTHYMPWIALHTLDAVYCRFPE